MTASASAAAGGVMPRSRDLAALPLARRLAWQDYAELALKDHLGRLLDYGCGNGEFLSRVSDRCDECQGVDVDAAALPADGAVGNATCRHVPAGGKLPFPDDYFDTVTILEVIEHVASERRVLDELTRVLKPGGRLLLTTPHRGLLTWLDPANAKFVAPRLHRFVLCTILRRGQYYEGRFGAARRAEAGMIGDFTTDQAPWHRHYRYGHIRRLAPDTLETVDWAVYYPAMRALWMLAIGAGIVSRGRFMDIPPPASWLAYRLSRTRSLLGDQLVVLFRKLGASRAPERR